jgi:hypothetical protein
MTRTKRAEFRTFDGKKYAEYKFTRRLAIAKQYKDALMKNGVKVRVIKVIGGYSVYVR